ncbi:MAG: aminotransferase class IV [Patescibacteria group bacterium]|nr:aminotransferase class IV [Patescibacteria group bacterium]
MKNFDYTKGVAFLRDKFIPFGEANIHIASSPVLYGLAVYTVFSLNWNEGEKKLYAFRFRDHYNRLVNSTRMMGFDGTDGAGFAAAWPYEKFEQTMLELARKNNIHEDALVRVSVFIDALIAGTKIHGLPIALSAYVYPLGRILNPHGINVCISSWVHVPSAAIPSRAKVNGAYANNSLMKNEALQNGFDDAIALDVQGRVCEGTVANLFLVKGGVLITPPVDADILEGITRRSIIAMAGDLGIKVEERHVTREELFSADEMFVCGSSARVVPILSVDRKAVGSGAAGPITLKFAEKYLAAQKGTSDEYKEWRMEVK